jgi:protein TonB
MTTATARNPNQRLALALAASACLHALLLAPANWLAPRAPPAPPPLQATLVEPERAQSLATEPEPELQPPPTPAAAPREPTLPTKQERPRELKGKGLDTALAALAKEEFYPRAAIARGLEGRVVLLLTLDEAGRVTGIEVASGSGHALLDDAALKAATRIAALPGGRRQVLLPVEFRLE